MTTQIKFKPRDIFSIVFGRVMSIERVEGRWKSYLLGADGKRGVLELAIPNELKRDELSQYLYDIYHEDATLKNGDVFEIVD